MKSSTIFSMLTMTKLPSAFAIIRGGEQYPDIEGVANFYRPRWDSGVVLEVEISHLPNTKEYSPRFLGLHIHQNGDCSNNMANTGMHYNPTEAVHPYHLGDLPPVLNSNGYSYMAVYDSFLSLEEIIGKSIILHNRRDDFTTQPAGDSGDKIACGVIHPISSLRNNY